MPEPACSFGPAGLPVPTLNTRIPPAFSKMLETTTRCPSGLKAAVPTTAVGAQVHGADDPP